MLKSRTRPVFLLFFFLFPVLAPVGSFAQTSAFVWTLQEAVQLALKNNPDITTTQARIQQAEANLIESKAAFYPQLSINGGYTRTDNPMYSFGNILNQGQFSKDIDFNKPGTTDAFLGQIMLKYQLYNGGQDKAAYKTAELQKEAALVQEMAIKNNLSYEVIRAYYTILAANDTLRARELALAAIKKALGQAQVRYQAGTLLKEEVLLLQTEDAHAEEMLIQAEHGKRLAEQGFLLLLGEEPGPGLRLAYNKNEAPVIPVSPPSGQRLELNVLDKLIAAQEFALKGAKSARYPKAEAFGSYQVEQGTEIDQGSGDSWTAGLRLNYTVFDGHRVAAAIQAEQAKLLELHAQRHKMALALAMEAEQARLNVDEETKKLATSSLRLQSSRENSRLTRIRFQEGLCTSTDFINSENRLTDAETGYAQTSYALHIAAAQLRKSYGLPLFGHRQEREQP